MWRGPCASYDRRFFHLAFTACLWLAASAGVLWALGFVRGFIRGVRAQWNFYRMQLRAGLPVVMSAKHTGPRSQWQFQELMETLPGIGYQGPRVAVLRTLGEMRGAGLVAYYAQPDGPGVWTLTAEGVRAAEATCVLTTGRLPGFSR